MHLVYCPNELRATVLNALGGKPRFAAEWSTFVNQAPNAECMIILADGGDNAHWERRFAEVRMRATQIPLVIVVRPTPTTIKWISRIDCDRFVWFDDLQEELPGQIAHVVRRGWRNRIVESIEANVLVSPWLKGVLLRAVHADPPPRTRKALVQLPMLRGKLRGHWEREIRAKGGGTIKDFLDALLLASACYLAQRGTKPTAIARRLGVDEKTLRLVARRRWQVPVVDLANVTDKEAIGRIIETLRPSGDTAQQNSQ
ncbi:MAG: hypothetical protein ACREMA_03145 [Longimicrobiales bacterium]